ncbi:hypothetical protein D3C87_1655900 [compost metagenome]
MLDTGIVDQDVDATHLADRVLDQLAHRRALGQIGAVVGHLHAILVGKVRAQLFNLGGVAKAIQDDVGALLGEGRGDSQADAAGGTGDKGDFSFEHANSPVIWREKREAETGFKCSCPARRQSCHVPTGRGVKRRAVCPAARTATALRLARCRPSAGRPCHPFFQARARAA